MIPNGIENPDSVVAFRLAESNAQLMASLEVTGVLEVVRGTLRGPNQTIEGCLMTVPIDEDGFVPQSIRTILEAQGVKRVLLWGVRVGEVVYGFFCEEPENFSQPRHLLFAKGGRILTSIENCPVGIGMALIERQLEEFASRHGWDVETAMMRVH